LSRGGLFLSLALLVLFFGVLTSGEVSAQGGGEPISEESISFLPEAEFGEASECLDLQAGLELSKNIVLMVAGLPNRTGIQGIADSARTLLEKSIGRLTKKNGRVQLISAEPIWSDGRRKSALDQAAASRGAVGYFIRGEIHDGTMDTIQKERWALNPKKLKKAVSSYWKPISNLLITLDLVNSSTGKALPSAQTKVLASLFLDGRNGKNQIRGVIQSHKFAFSSVATDGGGMDSIFRQLMELGVVQLYSHLLDTSKNNCLNAELLPFTLSRLRKKAKNKGVWNALKKGGGGFSAIMAKDQRKASNRIRKKSSPFTAKAPPPSRPKAPVSSSSSSYKRKPQAKSSKGRPSAKSSYSKKRRPPAKPSLSTGSKPLSSAGFTNDNFEITTDRGPRPQFSVNEAMKLIISVAVDLDVYCFYLDGGGTIVRLFPNRFHENPFVSAGSEQEIPGEEMPFRIRFASENVKEKVYCAGLRPGSRNLPREVLQKDLAPLSYSSLNSLHKSLLQLIPSLSFVQITMLVE
jgi:hypothetical protein